MTRLKTEWVEPMLLSMDKYNIELKRKTNMNLCDIFREKSSFTDKEVELLQSSIKVGVVPITQGEGIIRCFSESIAAIIQSMNFDAEVMRHTDVDGIYEGYRKNCDVLFMADDDRYVAVNTRKHKISDNNYATAYGYIEVLEALMLKEGVSMKESIQPILIIGYGTVGREAASILDVQKIEYCVFDKNTKVQESSGHPMQKDKKISDYKYILDFTNEGEWLSKEMLLSDTCYASPGVPCSLTEDAKMFLHDRAVYDNLEIGTAVMLSEVLSL